MSGPELITLGCRLNIAESEAMRALARGRDDLIIVNSCAITNEAVRRTRQAIRRAKRDRPDAELVVTGCAAEVEPEAFAAMPEVARVVSNREKLDLSSLQRRLEPQGVKSAADVRPEAPAFAGATAGFTPPPPAPRTRAFIAVQNGCDHRCTFCIIPFGRGESRSAPAGLVLDQVKAAVDRGAREVVLTGVDVTSYGPDLPGAPSLGLLVERILRHVPDLERLRLSSLDSVEIDPRLEEIIAFEPRFMPHLHMSFQAGDDMILKRMKRRHSRGQAIDTVRRLKDKRPEIAIGADLIAGFPTETEAMHLNSVSLIDECDIVMGHIFPYSPKAGTPAARMPQVPAAAIKARATRLRDAAARRKALWLEQMVGTRQRVLMERGGTGHAENFAPVTPRHPSEGWGNGDIVELTVVRAENGILIGAMP